MWIRHFNVLLLLLLPHVYCIPLTPEDLILKAKRKHHNSTRDNTTDKQGMEKTLLHGDYIRLVSELMMCKPLRQRSYLSTGDCDTIKPVYEVVCSGRCVVTKEHGHAWVHQLITGQRYRCKPSKRVKKKVKAVCKSNSQVIDIKIRIVESCKCVLTKKGKKKRKKRCKRKKGKLNKTDTKCKKRTRRKKQRHRKSRRKNKQRKNEKSTKLTNNDR